MDFSRAKELTPEVELDIEDCMEYHAWSPEQVLQGKAIRKALTQAIKMIVAHAPPSADRSSAIRLCRQARMEANSAITHGGKY